MGRCSDLIRSPSFPVALLLFLAGCVQMGVIKSLGICLEDITKDLRTTSTDIGTALGLFSAFSFIPAPIVAVLYRQHRFRHFLLIGGSCLITMGIILISMATHKVLIAVFLSISGLGTCLLMTASYIALSDFSSPHFNLIYSLAMSGNGLGMVLLPLLTEILLQQYGWRNALLLLGALIGHIIIPCAVVVTVSKSVGDTQADIRRSHNDDISGKPSCSMQRAINIDLQDVGLQNDTSYRGREIPNDETESDKETGHTECDPLSSGLAVSVVEVTDNNNELPKSAFGRLVDNFRTSDLCLDPVFNFLFFAIFLGAIVFCGWQAFLVPHALQRGLSIKDTLVITLSAAICNVSIKPLVGLLCNNLLISPVSVYLVLTFLNIAALLCDAFLSNFYVMVVAACFSASAIAGRSVASTLAVRERASPGKKDVLLAVDYFSFGIGNLLGGYLSGMIADVFMTYDVIFKLLAGIEVILFLVALVPWIINKPSSPLEPLLLHKLECKVCINSSYLQ